MRNKIIITIITLTVIIGLFGIFKLSHEAGAAQQSPAPLMGIAPPELKLFALHNNARETRGIMPLRASEVLFPLAEKQAHRMAKKERLFHGTYPNCIYWGQNVGAGAHVWNIFRAFMASPEHRANILNPNFHWVGIGVAVSESSTRWVAVDFCK